MNLDIPFLDDGHPPANPVRDVFIADLIAERESLLRQIAIIDRTLEALGYSQTQQAARP